MTKIRRIHRKPFRERADLGKRLTALSRVIQSLRDSDLPEDSKKRMLNNAVWEITIALGNFAPEFRSKGVLQSDVGTKLEREHVFKRKKIVADILSRSDHLESILSRLIHCVVTKEEHSKLRAVLDEEDGWSRYRAAGVDVYRVRNTGPEIMRSSRRRSRRLALVIMNMRSTAQLTRGLED